MKKHQYEIVLEEIINIIKYRGIQLDADLEEELFPYFDILKDEIEAYGDSRYETGVGDGQDVGWEAAKDDY